MRERTAKGRTTAETLFGITSLTRDQADAPRLPKRVGGHWSVEASFHVRDVTFGEDACRAHTGAAPVVLSAWRTAAVTMLRQAGLTNLAAALRRHTAHLDEALALVKNPSG